MHGLAQYYERLEESAKTRKLIDLLDSLQFNQVMIFVSTTKRADVLAKLLTKEAFPAMCMHSGLRQEERLKRYADFKDFKKRIMVSTDLCGRGIDIGKVNVVVNYDMPLKVPKLPDNAASD